MPLQKDMPKKTIFEISPLEYAQMLNKTKGRQWWDPSPKEIHYVLARCPDWFMYQCNGCQIQDTT